MSYIFNRENYECAKRNGSAERFRGDEISWRISYEEGYSLSAQIALLMDRDTKPEEVQKYQEARARVKAKVDEEIKAFEGEAK